MATPTTLIAKSPNENQSMSSLHQRSNIAPMTWRDLRRKVLHRGREMSRFWLKIRKYSSVDELGIERRSSPIVWCWLEAASCSDSLFLATGQWLWSVRIFHFYHHFLCNTAQFRRLNIADCVNWLCVWMTLMFVIGTHGQLGREAIFAYSQYSLAHQLCHYFQTVIHCHNFSKIKSWHDWLNWMMAKY